MSYLLLTSLSIAIALVVILSFIQKRIIFSGQSKSDPRTIVYAGAGLLIVLAITGYLLTESPPDKSQDYIEAGFIQESKNIFVKNYDGFRVTVFEHQSRRNEHSNQSDRIEISIQSKQDDNAIRKLFCSEKEYEDFVRSDSQWFPTEAKQLSNQHYIGVCYPQESVEQIAKLPPQNHGFKPKAARYLFIPKVQSKQNELRLVFSEGAPTELDHRLQAFITYYRQYMPASG